MNLHVRIFSTLLTASLMSAFAAQASGVAPSPGGQDDKAARNSSTGEHAHKHPRTPRTELFLGYSHFRSVPTYQNGNRMVALNGGEASFAINFNRDFAVLADFGGYADSQLRLTGSSINEPRDVDSTGKAFTYMAGPRFTMLKGHRVSPFVQVLAGAIHASPVVIANCAGGAACTALPAQTAFSMTAGGGLDVRLTHHIALRLVQAEYMMTRFSDVDTGATGRQNDVRLSAGLVFGFGGGRDREIPAANRPPTVSCSADSKTIYTGSGDSLAVHATASDPDNDVLSYAWTATGGAVVGTGPDVQWNSTGVAAGAYSIHISVNDNRGGTADCAVHVQVETQRNHAPALTCTVDRTPVQSGESVRLTTTASDSDGDPLAFTWSTTGGRITGSGASVNLDTTSLSAGTYVVTGHVDDGRGGATDCTVNVDVQARPPTPLELKLALHSIYFPTGQPTADQPEWGLLASQKATLATLAVDFKTYLESQPDARLTLEGHADPRGSSEYNQRLSERRVEITKTFLIAHGVPAASLDTKAFGLQHELSASEVKEALENNPELTSDQRRKLLDNSTAIVLASNRRVDVTLNGTGQRSTRVYPFNAKDYLSLLRQQQAGKPTAATLGHKK